MKSAGFMKRVAKASKPNPLPPAPDDAPAWFVKARSELGDRLSNRAFEFRSLYVVAVVIAVIAAAIATHAINKVSHDEKVVCQINLLYYNQSAARALERSTVDSGLQKKLDLDSQKASLAAVEKLHKTC